MHTICDWCNLPIEKPEDCREVDHHHFHKDRCEATYRAYCREKRLREQGKQEPKPD